MHVVYNLLSQFAYGVVISNFPPELVLLQRITGLDWRLDNFCNSAIIIISASLELAPPDVTLRSYIVHEANVKNLCTI